MKCFLTKHSLKKSTLVAALAVAAGLGAAAAQAVPVASWQLGDFDNDGLQSDFAFFAPPSGSSRHKFGATGEMCGDSPCGPIIFDAGPIGPDVFTAGLLLGGAVTFKPNVTGNMAADITGGVLTWSALDFGAMFGEPPDTQMFLAPDDLATVYVLALTDLDNNQWGVVIYYISTIQDPSNVFYGFVANMRLEGVMTVVPLPAAAWLMGWGLLGMLGFVRWGRDRSD